MLNRRNLAGLLFLSALVVPIAGCGDDTIDPTMNFVNPSTIRVTNNLEGAVLFFFVRTCGTTNWGEDLLPLDPLEGVISVGTSKDFTVEGGCYDLWAQHLEGPAPGPLIDKMAFDQVASPVAILNWVLEEISSGPS
ncbi:MAG: hypothetical protein MJB57_00155 [Gemmatimonadetes bacterium]|nr:hypothetical protein [Gemmatimonadota bacterium]